VTLSSRHVLWSEISYFHSYADDDGGARVVLHTTRLMNADSRKLARSSTVVPASSLRTVDFGRISVESMIVGNTVNPRAKSSLYSFLVLVSDGNKARCLIATITLARLITTSLLAPIIPFIL